MGAVSPFEESADSSGYGAPAPAAPFVSTVAESVVVKAAAPAPAADDYSSPEAPVIASSPSNSQPVADSYSVGNAVAEPISNSFDSFSQSASDSYGVAASDSFDSFSQSASDSFDSFSQEPSDSYGAATSFSQPA